MLEAISRLNATSTNLFLGRLLAAEVGLLELDSQAFAYAQDERVRDGGVDAFLTLPSDVITPFPTGRTVWQFKSSNLHNRPRSAAEITHQSKQFVRDQIAHGSDYVLAWTQSPPPETQARIRTEFEEAVRGIRDDAVVQCLFGEHIDLLSGSSPGCSGEH